MGSDQYWYARNMREFYGSSSGPSTCGEHHISLEGLGQDERKVIVWLRDRLLAAKEKYGDLDLAADKRDWKKERSEEIGDLLVYTAFMSLKDAIWTAPTNR